MAGPQRWKRQVTAVVVVAAVLVAVVGSLFFVVALSPVRLALDQGTHVRYRLSTEIYALGEDQPRSTSEEVVHLICVDRGNDVALIREEEARRGELTLMRFDSDGSVRRYDPALRLLEEGKAVGFFDFNLLPLPSGLEQDWRVDITYAVPPPRKRQWPARVRRVANGFNPEFELTLPPMHWIDDRPGRGWVRIADLVCRYRYNGRHGVVDHAVVSFVVGQEIDGAKRERRVRLTLDGEVAHQGGEGEVAALRDLAIASYGAQSMLEDGRTEELGPLVSRLREASDAGPSVLREVARDLARAAALEADLGAETGARWVVQVAAVTAARREQAERLAHGLAADGYPAFVREREGQVTICVGPYRQRRDRVLAELRERFPRERPLWREWREGR